MVMHRWRGYDHQDLYDMINSGPGPAASTPQTVYWGALETELSAIDSELSSKLGKLKAGWEGGAADQANTGMTPLQAWASDAQTGAGVMRMSTEMQADYIAKARSEMPEPVEVTTPAPSGWSKFAAGAALLTGNSGPASAVLAQSHDHEHQEAAQNAASEKAVDTMDNYQSSSTANTDTLGEFVPPPDVVVSTPAPSGATDYSVTHYAAHFSGANGGTHANYATGSPGTVGHIGGNGYVAPGQAHGGNHYSAPGALPGAQAPTKFHPPAGSTSTSGFTPSGVADPNLNLNRFDNTLTGGGNGRFNQNNTFNGQGSFNGNLGLTGGVSGADGLDSAGRLGGRGGSGSAFGGPGAAGEAAGQSGQLGRGGASGAGGLGGPGENVLGTRAGAATGGKGGLGGVGGGNRGQDDEDETEYESASYLVETDDVFGDERGVAQAVLGVDE
ncbi:PPE domain-containing protein [Actinokineospora inagensis]|uniref:PPE domain-containing protein n=1 Tax=Actinokineospora inagensis TaxID=103730 RepID=UPI000A01CAB2|nr:PPE domain-containing protein [Actinokineospora inagensis]